MNQEEFRFHVLARVLMTDNQELISNYAKFFTTYKFINVDLIDKCNLPLLMSQHAASNPDMQKFQNHVAALKDQIYQIQKPVIMELFKAGLTRKSAGRFVDFERFMLLVLMLRMEDPDYVRLAYQLFNELNFELVHYMMVIDTARQAQHIYPEAEQLVRKILLIVRSLEEVDEDLEIDPPQEDLVQEEENDDDNVSIASADSGFYGESEGMLDEDSRFGAEMNHAFELAFREVLLMNLSDCLKSRDMQRVHLALEALSPFKIPLFLYQKHEICRKINQYRSLLAYGLFSEIEEMAEKEYKYEKHEVFTKILKAAKGDFVTNEFMALMMTYWRHGEQDFYIHNVIRTLLEKKFSAYQVEEFDIIFRLRTTTWKIPEFSELHSKIIRLQFNQYVCSTCFKT